MTARQQFFGPVHGSVSQRDLIFMDSRPLTECEEQERFRRATGIVCSKEARHQLEHLLEVHDFTASELRRCSRTGALRWCRERRTWVATSGAHDQSTAHILFGLLSLGLAVATAWIYATFAALGALVMPFVAGAYLAGVYAVAVTLVLPQQTAHSAVQVLGATRAKRFEVDGAMPSAAAAFAKPLSKSTRKKMSMKLAPYAMVALVVVGSVASLVGWSDPKPESLAKIRNVVSSMQSGAGPGSVLTLKIDTPMGSDPASWFFMGAEDVKNVLRQVAEHFPQHGARSIDIVIPAKLTDRHGTAKAEDVVKLRWDADEVAKIRFAGNFTSWDLLNLAQPASFLEPAGKEAVAIYCADTTNAARAARFCSRSL